MALKWTQQPGHLRKSHCYYIELNRKNKISPGARPLKRTIQQRLENPLAGELLAGKFTDGDTIKIDADAHKFTFEKIKTA